MEENHYNGFKNKFRYRLFYWGCFPICLIPVLSFFIMLSISAYQSWNLYFTEEKSVAEGSLTNGDRKGFSQYSFYHEGEYYKGFKFGGKTDERIKIIFAKNNPKLNRHHFTMYFDMAWTGLLLLFIFYLIIKAVLKKKNIPQDLNEEEKKQT